jgi:hypothetical protein
MILLFIIIVSVIIGLNIVSVVDKKLGTVAINIPPVELPQIVIKVCESDNMSENDIKRKYKMVVINSKKSENEEVENFDTIEKQIPVQEEQQISNVSSETETIIPIVSKFISSITNSEEHLLPNSKDIVQEQKLPLNEVNFANVINEIIKPSEIKLPEEEQVFRCKNKSIVDKFKAGNENLKPFGTCGQKKLNEIDPAQYYKQKYSYYVSQMGNEKMNGYNFQNYSSYAGIFDIGKIVLDKTHKYPNGMNSS